MYRIDQIMDMIRKTIETYHSISCYAGYFVSLGNIAEYMKMGATRALGTGVPMYIKFAEIEHAITYIINHMYDKFDEDFIVQMAKDISIGSHAGILRDREIKMDDDTVLPPTVHYNGTIAHAIDEFVSSSHDPIDIAIQLFMYFESKNMFTGDNMLLSLMVANKVLLHSDTGILYVPMVQNSQVRDLIARFKNQDKGARAYLFEYLKQFIYNVNDSTEDTIVGSKDNSNVSLHVRLINKVGKKVGIGATIKVYTNGGWINSGGIVKITGFKISADEKIVIFDGDINQPISGIIDFEVVRGNSHNSHNENLNTLLGATDVLS